MISYRLVIGDTKGLLSAPWNSLILAMHHDGAKIEGVSKKNDKEKKKKKKKKKNKKKKKLYIQVRKKKI